MIEFNLLVLDKITWNNTTVWKLFVEDKNTWYNIDDYCCWEWILILNLDITLTTFFITIFKHSKTNQILASNNP